MFVQAVKQESVNSVNHDPVCIVVPGTTLLECLSATAKPDPGWYQLYPGWCQPDPGQLGYYRP
jgi:hypothetical protein